MHRRPGTAEAPVDGNQTDGPVIHDEKLVRDEKDTSKVSEANLNNAPVPSSEKAEYSASVLNAAHTTSAEGSTVSGSTQVAAVEMKETTNNTDTRNSSKRGLQENIQFSSPSLVAHVSESSGAVVLAEKNPTGVPPLPPLYVSPRKNNKRLKKGLIHQKGEGEDDTTETTNASSAGSHEGRRRAQ